MTTRRLSQLVVLLVTPAFLLTGLLSSSTTSAAKPDKSPPTTPTNLTVTAVTDTTITVGWNASSDNSGKLSYRLKINNLDNAAYNSLATISQSQTTYMVRYLPPNNRYTFAIYAIDAAGNRSADSNTASARTLADTTAPSAPVLESAVLSPSQIQLTWTKSLDNVASHCCTYGINMNGSSYTGHINWAAAPAGKLSATIRHLTPATNYSFSISATDWSGGNVATSNTVTAKTHSSSDTTPPTAPTNLYLYRDDSCGEVWLGWTEAMDNADPQEQIEYEIWVNGVLSPLPVSAGVNIDFVYATLHGDNMFVVKAVDRSGNTSAASQALKLFLWPC